MSAPPGGRVPLAGHFGVRNGRNDRRNLHLHVALDGRLRGTPIMRKAVGLLGLRGDEMQASLPSPLWEWVKGIVLGLGVEPKNETAKLREQIH